MADPGDMDVVDLLTHQHQRIRAMIDAVEKTRDPGARQEKFDELRRFLAVHETAEELVTHPRARLADGGNAVVDARLEEETESKKMLAELDGMSVSDAGFSRKFNALKIAVLDHARAEEHEEFPLLRAREDKAVLDRMATAVRAAEAVAPTHPHPTAGSSMTSNLMAGPLASLVDRTRDAVTEALR